MGGGVREYGKELRHRRGGGGGELVEFRPGVSEAGRENPTCIRVPPPNPTLASLPWLGVGERGGNVEGLDVTH